MTTPDRNILTKELRGFNLRNVSWMVGLFLMALGFAHKHYSAIIDKQDSNYSSLMKKMDDIATAVTIKQKVDSICYVNLKQQCDKHEKLLTSN